MTNPSDDLLATSEGVDEGSQASTDEGPRSTEELTGVPDPINRRSATRPRPAPSPRRDAGAAGRHGVRAVAAAPATPRAAASSCRRARGSRPPRLAAVDDDRLLDARLDALEADLRSLDGVLVAFSGGADSAFLLAAAARALGPERVVAATAVSPSLAADELPAARAFAAGARRPPPDARRPTSCPARATSRTAPTAASTARRRSSTPCGRSPPRWAWPPSRPGPTPTTRSPASAPASAPPPSAARATPLLDAGLTKAQVRAASRRWGLATADKPALACLASRIAYGLQVTPAGLARVDRAERALRAHLGEVVDLRVRDLGEGRRPGRARPGGAGPRCDAAALDVVRAEGFARGQRARVPLRVDERGAAPGRRRAP